MQGQNRLEISVPNPNRKSPPLSFFNAAEGHQNIRVVTLRQWLGWAAGLQPTEWHVSLPMIQRGFVWKNAQILELWDTLLRGLPVGALLVSELKKGVKNISLTQGDQATDDAGGMLGLVDGQQRTLAMLIGWPLPSTTLISHRLWVDFADKPHSGERLRLRLTTRNQPFGYTRDNPNAKLPLAERRKAQLTWQATQSEHARMHGEQLPDFRETQPWSNKPSLPLELRDLIQWWQELNGDQQTWKSKVLTQVKTLTGPYNSPIWASLEEGQKSLVEPSIDELFKGLARIHTAQIPLIRLDDRLFSAEPDNDTDKSTETPLALLFKRIGSNATPLSDDDYVYAILKHLRPEVHDMVTRLHGHRHTGQGQASVASLMKPTGLAMSALRLAAATWIPQGKEQSTDPIKPSKEQFHRLIDSDGFLAALLPLLTEGYMQKWFDQTLDCLEYRGGTDPGLPRHALPCLSRQLVQVLLRLAQVGYLNTNGTARDETRRRETLRLTLYWWLCVHDQNKASLAAYRVIKKDAAVVDDMPQKIMQAIVEDAAGHELPSPARLSERYGLTSTPATLSPTKARGESRFTSIPDAAGDRELCEFWRRWHAPWTHRHPILLWLQRSYVATLPGDPFTQRDEDTPYDYDHLLPSLHWSGWTGVTKGARFIDFCEHAHVIGNSIGNIRVWGSSDNRSDGAASPARKLRLIALDTEEGGQTRLEREAIAAELLEESAIAARHQVLWRGHLSPAKEDSRVWNLERAKAFEHAVEQRAFWLYQRFFIEPDFAPWLLEANASNALAI